MSKASKGKSKSEEHIKALSIAKIGKKRKPHSEETKKKMSIIQKEISASIDRSFMQTEEYKQKQSEISTKAWEKRKSDKFPIAKETSKIIIINTL
mgnify:CR=1 FL=1